MRQEVINVYKFDELPSERAKEKEKAREWWRSSSSSDPFWSECVIEDAQQCAEILGIEIGKARHSKEPAVYWSGFSCQGDGASFEGRYRYAKGAAKAIREHAPQDSELHRIADRLQALQRRIFYRGIFDIKASGRYSHEYTMSLERCEECPDDIADDFLDTLRDFARWIYKSLESEYEWQNSDSEVDESIRCNEYEFTADGEIL
jgi:hypothetical protein